MKFFKQNPYRCHVKRRKEREVKGMGEEGRRKETYKYGILWSNRISFEIKIKKTKIFQI